MKNVTGKKIMYGVEVEQRPYIAMTGKKVATRSAKLVKRIKRHWTTR